jgi:hypothetical protein
MAIVKPINNYINISIVIILLLGGKITLFGQFTQPTLSTPPIHIQKDKTLSFKPNWEINQIPNAFSIQKFDPVTLPFFCKMEHKIEKNSKIAFRFRVGDLNYVNMLENKR